jgi:ribosomal protein L35AE/L33A
MCEFDRLESWLVFNKPRLFGYISKYHGGTGNLRVKFKKGLPGQALGTKVKISKK